MTLAQLRIQTLRFVRRALPQQSAVYAEGAGRFDTCGGGLIFITSTGATVARQVKVASAFGDRLRGLLNRRALNPDEGLLLSPGRSIHTIGMRFPIDVLFLDRHTRVLKCASHVPPWRVARAPAGTCHVLELAGGRVAAANIKVGMRLLWSEATASG